MCIHTQTHTQARVHVREGVDGRVGEGKGGVGRQVEKGKDFDFAAGGQHEGALSARMHELLAVHAHMALRRCPHVRRS